MCRYKYLFILTDFNGSLWVFIGPYSSLWTLMGLYGSFQVLMCLCESL